MKQVLFLDTVHPVLAGRLEAAGYRCHYDYTSNYQEVCAKLQAYSGIVIRSRLPIDAELIAAGGSLEFIARSGSGLENIDLEAAAKKGIRVISSPEGNRDAVAEHALGMLLMLFNKLSKAHAEVRQGIWDREGNRGLELAGKTVGIIGYGQTGAAFAKRLQGFRCRIMAYDKYKKGFGSELIAETSLAELQTQADIISIHLPLSAETDYFVDRRFIDACAKPFYLLNTARGRHVNTADLVDALEKGKIRGACLDVLEYEKKSLENLDAENLPAAFSKLLAHPGVILTPHVAGWTVESYVKLSEVLADKILKESLPL